MARGIPTVRGEMLVLVTTADGRRYVVDRQDREMFDGVDGPLHARGSAALQDVGCQELCDGDTVNEMHRSLLVSEITFVEHRVSACVPQGQFESSIANAAAATLDAKDEVLRRLALGDAAVALVEAYRERDEAQAAYETAHGADLYVLADLYVDAVERVAAAAAVYDGLVQ